MSPPERGIGRCLSHTPHAKRTIVVQLGEDTADEDASAAVRCILQACGDWIFIERHVKTVPVEQAAWRYGQEERESLINNLGPVTTISPGRSSDLYLLSGDGKVLVVWDHHTCVEGLAVAFNDTEKSGEVLLSLNHVGTEMDIYYAS
jgi:hypothetical protein